MFINKVLELYREACQHGLSVSLSINNLNGQESFSLATIRAQTWLAGQSAAAVPDEDEDREDADRTNRSVAQKQPNQLLSRPPMPLSSDHRHRRFSLQLLSAPNILALLSGVPLLHTLPRNTLTKLPRALLALLPTPP